LTAKREWTWTAVALVIGLGVVLATHADYGITWDEGVQAEYGERVVEYFLSGFSDRRADEFLDTRYYGPLFEGVAALASAAAADSTYEIRHLLVAVTGLFGALGVLRLGRLLAVPWVGAYAAGILILLPRFYGHAFVNSKDVPFAALFIWSVFALCRFALAPREWLRVAVCGLAVGSALAIRPGGAPILLALLVCVIGFAAFTRRTTGPLLLGGICACALAWLVMVAVWPWAHLNPLGHPIEAMRAALAFPAAYPVLFQGEVFRSDQLPRHYVVMYLLITTPPLALGLAGIGLLATLRIQRRGLGHPAALVSAAVQVWLLLPLALATLTRPNVYDGIRHFLFILPAVALLAGLGAASLLQFARTPRHRIIVATALAGAVCLPVVSLVRLHPYQMTYFNLFVGGLRGADGRYETDYWVSSYREAIEWVNQQAGGREVQVLVAANSYSTLCASHYLAPGVRMSTLFRGGLEGELPEGVDYYVSTRRYGFDRNFAESPVVHEVGRAGGTFTVIRGRRARW
jgi:hypothetical protein